MAKRDVGDKPESRVGSRVYFGAPRDVAKKGGTTVGGVVVDEVWVEDTARTPEDSGAVSEHSWGKYGFSAQRIRWDHGGESIRLGYWRMRAGENHWDFAAQTTVTSRPATIKRLLEVTLERAEWFEE